MDAVDGIAVRAVGGEPEWPDTIELVVKWPKFREGR